MILVLLALFLISPAQPALAGGQDVPDFVEQVFLTEPAALKQAFPDADKVEEKIHRFTMKERHAIEGRLGWTLAESSVTVHEGFKDGRLIGRAMIAEEIGKFKPISFLVKVSPEGRVDRVEILVYREAVGADVRRQRFLRQFKGKTARDGLRINRDILNVTGATMSVQAVSAGVKKTLVILDEIYKKTP